MGHRLQDGGRDALSAAAEAQERDEFVRANTALIPVPLVPEIRLHLASEAIPLWQKTEDELGAMGLPPPFWAFAWAGGQALARHILDDPATVTGKRVLDIGAGSGLGAIAASLAGAARVEATEIDPHAIAAIRLNAVLNGVAVTARLEDVLDGDVTADLILAGDIFYEKPLAERALRFLESQAARGAAVLIGDPGRSYLPRDRLDGVASYSVPVSRDLEDTEIKNTAVWRLAPVPA